MMILGTNLLMGGLLVTIIVVGEASFLSFFAQASRSLSAVLGLILTLVGFFFVLIGFILVVHYDKEKSWYINEIEKSTTRRKGKTNIKTINEMLKEHTYKRKRS